MPSSAFSNPGISWEVYAGSADDDGNVDHNHNTLVDTYTTEIEAREARVEMMERNPNSTYTIRKVENPDLASTMDNAESMGMVVNEMRVRHEAIMSPKGSRWVNNLSSFGFFMKLGFTPAAAMVNMSQTAFVALPQLGARFGWGAASSALGRYTKTYAGDNIKGVGALDTDEYMTAQRMKDLDELMGVRKEQAWVDKTPSTLLTKKGISSRQRAALMELYETGTLDMSQNSDLAMIAHNDAGFRAGGGTFAENSKFNAAMKYSSYLFQNVEVFNREVTGLAAYDLAYDKAIKDGKAEAEAHAEAVKFASTSIDRGHFDYTSENRPTFMQGNLGRVVFQFKQYSQNMTYRLFRDLNQWIVGETKEERRIARRELTGIVGMHTVFAGVAGMPFMTLPLMFEVMNQAMGDDDDPYDAEVEFKLWLAENLGQEGAEYIMRGAFRAIPGIENADISPRISLNGLWLRDDDRDYHGAESELWWMKQLLGVHASWLGDAIKAKGLYDAGQWQKGSEMLMPKQFKDISKAIRNASEGEVSKAGITQLGAEKFDWGDTAAQVIGFNPTTKSNMYDRRSAIYNRREALRQRRTSLKNRWIQAYRDGDYDTRKEIEAEIYEYNQSNPENRLTRKTLRRALKGKEGRQERTIDGVNLGKSEWYLERYGNFVSI